jgi:DNA gyrase subunit A
MRTLVADELRQVKEAYADRRRTQIARLGAGAKSLIPVLTASDLLPEREIWVSATADGLVGRTLDEKPPRPSGMAAPRFLLQVNTRDTLFLVSTNGDAAGIPVEALPEAENPQSGAPLHKVSALPEGSTLAAMFTLPPKEERLPGWSLFTATRQGLVKKTQIEELPGPTGKPFTLVKVNEDDALGWVQLTNGKAQVLLVTADGMAIRFSEEEVRPMGMVAAGVGGIKLGARDEVAGMALIPAKGEVLLVSADGKAKRIPVDQFPLQGRYGQGVIAWKLPRTTQVAGIAVGKPNLRVTLHLEKLAPKSMRLDEAPQQTRAASGKAIIEFKTGVKVLAVSTSLEFPRPTSKPMERPARPVDEESESPAPVQVEQLTFGIDAPALEAVEKPAARKPRSRTSTAQVKTETVTPARKKVTRGTTASPPEPHKTRSSLKGETTEPKPARQRSNKKVTEIVPPAPRRTRLSSTAAKPAAKAPAKGTPAGKTPAKPTPKPASPAPKKPSAKKPAVKKAGSKPETIKKPEVKKTRAG